MLKTVVLSFLFGSVLFAYPNISDAVKVKKIYPMGKKVYEKRCDKVDIAHYKTYEALIKDIPHYCHHLNTKYTQAVALYLWDGYHQNIHHTYYEKLTVTKDDKCPVCGMFLAPYPQWVSRIYYGKKSFSFDGIKDMMKFYFQQKEGATLLLVQDYYTDKTIDAKKAYFVIGSDVYGPMGNELIAFETKKSAKRFFLDHRGKKIVTFPEITPELVFGLDQ